MDRSEFASEVLLPHSSCCEPESSRKLSFSTASFCRNTRQTEGAEGHSTNRSEERGAESRQHRRTLSCLTATIIIIVTIVKL